MIKSVDKYSKIAYNKDNQGRKKKHGTRKTLHFKK